MIERARYYIVLFFFKYFLISLVTFVGLIWISQTLRIIEFQYSISHQIIDVSLTTLLALPSFINPLIPFLILLGGFFINYKFNSTNEIIILKQYLSINKINELYLVIIFILVSIYFLNNEFISKSFYEVYKKKELDIRNNLKLGSPAKNEFHIDDIISIFFEEKKDSTYHKIQAIIYPENQFINSKSVSIELSKSNFNLVFDEGERLILNENEKSKTLFDKFTYTLLNKEYELLLMDKEHYNTLELINHKNKDFINHGHNNIIQYIFLILISIVSLKIIFFYENKKNNIYKFSFIFFVILIIQIFNSYLIYLLNNFDQISVTHYYIINFISFFFGFTFIQKLIK